MNEIIKDYASRYRKHQIRLTYVLTIIIIIFGVLVFATGLILAIYHFQAVRCVIGCITAVAGILDITLAFKFCKVSLQKVRGTPDKEAAMRYSRITGNPLTPKKEEEKEKK